MTNEEHYRKLEGMYNRAPVNRSFFVDSKMEISAGKALIRQEVNPDLFHAGGGLHGAIYFKMLDDAAYFAAATTIRDTFLVTKSYEIHFLRPINGGELVATGRFISQEGRELKAKSVLTVNGKIVGKGSGIFVSSRRALDEAVGYG